MFIFSQNICLNQNNTVQRQSEREREISEIERQKTLFYLALVKIQLRTKIKKNDSEAAK